MRILLSTILLLLVLQTVAQIKMPTRKTVEKKVEKAIDETLNNNNSNQSKNSSDNKPATTIPAEETKSPAKAQINTFWKHIEKMRNHTKEDNKQVVYSSGIQSAQMALNNTKTKDPAYNTIDMEKALEECKNVYNGQASGKQNLRDSRTATIEYMEQLIREPFLFTKGELKIGGDSTQRESAVNNALAASDAVIKQHEEKVMEFLNTQPEELITKPDLGAAKAKASAVTIAIKKAEEAYKTETSIASVYYLQQLYLYKAYLDGALKIFPGDATLKQHQDMVVAAIDKMGSRQGYMNKLKENYKEWVKNLKIGKPVLSDPAIEKLVTKEFESWGSWDKMKVTKVNIVKPWILEKNALDIPVKKETHVHIAFTKPDGSCGLGTMYVVQEYEGGGKYGTPYTTFPTILASTIPCENVK